MKNSTLSPLSKRLRLRSGVSRSKEVRQPVFPPDRTHGQTSHRQRHGIAAPAVRDRPPGDGLLAVRRRRGLPAAGAEDGDWGVRAAFREGLAQLGSRALVERVPEINAVGVEHVPTGALVRFRCMVQDMYNPEYYVGAYRDAGGRWRTTKYTEDLGPEDLGPGTHSPADSQNLGRDACCTACPCPARARGCGAWTARASAPPRVRPRRPARSAPPRRTRGRATRTSRWTPETTPPARRRTRSPPRAPARAPRRTRSTPPAPLRRSETTRREPGSNGKAAPPCTCTPAGTHRRRTR